MTKKEMINTLAKAMDIGYVNNNLSYESQSEQIIDILLEHGMMPPCLPKNKSRYLTNKYVFPEYHQWEEDFDKENGCDFLEYQNRPKNTKRSNRV